jgi:hypothetical protein
MQPMLFIDSAKTSSLEGAATTVYAQGGKGNPRLIGWEVHFICPAYTYPEAYIK